MKKGLTKIELERQKKREMEADADYFKEVDLPGGWKYVGDYEADKAKQDTVLQDGVKSNLQESGPVTYLTHLAAYTQDKLDRIENAKGWKLDCIATYHNRSLRVYGKTFPTKEGVQIILRAPSGVVYSRGISTTLDPTYDIKAMNVLVEQVENTIDAYQGNTFTDRKSEVPGYKKRESGLIVPE